MTMLGQIKMIDILEKNKNIEIHIANDGRIWINIEGICCLRINRTNDINIIDERVNKKG